VYRLAVALELSPAERVGGVAKDALRVRFADGDFMHLAAERAIDRESLGPRLAQAFHIRLDAGGRSLFGVRAGEKQCRHDSLPCLPAGARSLSPDARGAAVPGIASVAFSLAACLFNIAQRLELGRSQI
jgi:hypothetical protein